MTDKLKAMRDELALAQRIYEPKYGGKDHSGYDTLMKYEINDEREECFKKGFDACAALLLPEIERLREALENILDPYMGEDGIDTTAREALEANKKAKGDK